MTCCLERLGGISWRGIRLCLVSAWALPEGIFRRMVVGLVSCAVAMLFEELRKVGAGARHRVG